MTKANRTAGFWIRFLARIIDFVIFGAASVGIAFGGLSRVARDFSYTDKGVAKVETIKVLQFTDNWYFYVWIVASILIIFTMFILIPFFFKRTFGMFVCRIEIKFDEKKNRFLQVMKREAFMGWLWIFMFVLVGLVINHTLFNTFAIKQTDAIKASYSTLDNLRISVVSTIGGLAVIGQLICGVSIVIRRSKVGLHDSFSNTRTIWSSRFVEVKQQEEKIKSIPPRLVKQEIVEWIE